MAHEAIVNVLAEIMRQDMDVSRRVNATISVDRLRLALIGSDPARSSNPFEKGVLDALEEFGGKFV